MRRRRRSRRNGVVRGATSEPITSPGRIGGRESIGSEPRRASGSNHRGGISPSRILKTRLPLDQNGHLYGSCAPVRGCALASRTQLVHDEIHSGCASWLQSVRDQEGRWPGAGFLAYLVLPLTLRLPAGAPHTVYRSISEEALALVFMLWCARMAKPLP